ncbi:alpha/beta-hydrolase [Colletotrichum tofieldiae]|uniref:Alpha/beta-hydrolase n=1 Tax=Colletotrichum tofieldiae TaxID=708197 RepID=A0A161YCB9_9PEZI|nr:alpha/beta-hydrolase [Colletotrichum tofieldiae]
MSSKPTFIFVPGAWHCATKFLPVTSELEALGYTTRSIQLPCFGAEPPLADFWPDVTAVRQEIQKVIDDGHDVVLFMHSYGGIIGCEACRGLDKTARQKQGKPGGVVRLVFCAAFLAPEGVSLFDMLQGNPLPWFIVSDDNMRVDPLQPEKIFYNDLDEKAAKEAVSGLKHHSYQTFSSKLTYAAWKDVPVTYIKCELDKAIPPQAQQQMIEVAGADVVVESIETGHSPFLSKPDLVTTALRRSAGEAC